MFKVRASGEGEDDELPWNVQVHPASRDEKCPMYPCEMHESSERWSHVHPTHRSDLGSMFYVLTCTDDRVSVALPVTPDSASHGSIINRWLYLNIRNSNNESVLVLVQAQVWRCGGSYLFRVAFVRISSRFRGRRTSIRVQGASLRDIFLR
jgi:hypothetical protein